MIFFKADLNYKVTGIYRKCKTPVVKKEKLCLCATYIRVLVKGTVHFAYINFCDLYSLKEDYLKFRYYNNNEFNYPEINCDYVITDENEENEWKNVPISFGYFKCATLKSSNCKNYVVTWNAL
jgi:hypothetical protein